MLYLNTSSASINAAASDPNPEPMPHLPSPLDDALLLKITHRENLDQNRYPTVLEDLRAVCGVFAMEIKRFSTVPQAAAMALLVDLLGREWKIVPGDFMDMIKGKPANSWPIHLEWILRSRVECIANQIFGFIALSLGQSINPNSTQAIVDLAIRRSFIEERWEDHRTFGMASGSGQECLLHSTLFGVAQARRIIADASKPKPIPKSPSPRPAFFPIIPSQHLEPASISPVPLPPSALDTIDSPAPHFELLPPLPAEPQSATDLPAPQSHDAQAEPASIHLSRPEADILRVLHATAGRRMGNGALALKAKVSESNFKKLIPNLRDLGLVEKPGGRWGWAITLKGIDCLARYDAAARASSIPVPVAKK